MVAKAFFFFLLQGKALIKPRHHCSLKLMCIYFDSALIHIALTSLLLLHTHTFEYAFDYCNVNLCLNISALLLFRTIDMTLSWLYQQSNMQCIYQQVTVVCLQFDEVALPEAWLSLHVCSQSSTIWLHITDIHFTVLSLSSLETRKYDERELISIIVKEEQ